MDQRWQDISQGLPPTAEHWRERLQGVLANVWDVLPDPTIHHLINALRMWYANVPDLQRVATGQAVESLFQEWVLRSVQNAGEDGVSVRLQSGGSAPRGYDLSGRYTFQISQWAQILDTVGRGSPDNLPFEFALNKAFQNVDLRALGNLNADLRNMARLRGSASHHSHDSFDRKVGKASELWNIVVGGEESTGFIEKLCTALGLVEREPGQSGKGGGTVR